MQFLGGLDLGKKDKMPINNWLQFVSLCVTHELTSIPQCFAKSCSKYLLYTQVPKTNIIWRKKHDVWKSGWFFFNGIVSWILAILKLKKSVQFIVLKFHFFKISKQGVCVTLWPCHLHLKSILRQKKNYGNSNISP
jgi:uncharacterized membrane protein YhaH (DUF805 family)